MFFVFLAMLLTNVKSVTVRYTNKPPDIDGYIENLWLKADSAYSFIQYKPQEGEPTTEPTVVYVLADDDNIYFAYRCWTPGRRPFASFKGLEDHVYLFLDSFDNKTTGYFFSVCASGYRDDGLILEDGKVWDWSWDGVWFYGVKCYDDRLEIEIKIPFKSIRYKKGVAQWGVNFERMSIKDNEMTYWQPVNKKDGLQISQFGRLMGLNPRTSGYYIELYPEGFVRYDEIEDQRDFKPSASLNLKWDITSQTTINTTILPDFAQIESDPYTLNLSRYPVRLDERRPFFVEGSDVFRMSDLGQGYFTPLEIFYSRRIGKPLSEGGALDILGGLKFSAKEKRWNIGLLSALTEKTDDEPYRGFAVLRSRRSIMKNSEIGFLVSSTATNLDYYNYAVGFDGAFRHGPSQFIIQSALSNREGRKGWALSSGGLYKTGAIFANASILTISDSFDVTDVGYVPWSGLTKFYLSIGPNRFFKKGPLLQYFFGPGLVITKEPGSGDWSKTIFFSIDPRFRSGWGISLRPAIGRLYEADTNYLYRTFYLAAWSGYHKKYNTDFGINYTYAYNYYRNWLAGQLSCWLWGGYFPISPLSLSASIDFVFEWNPDGDLTAITPYTTPRIEYKITKDIEVAVYSQLVLQCEDGNMKNAEAYSNRLGFLFSWNFLPKSWLYVAFNDYRENAGSGLEPRERIAAVKIKYLIYF